MPDLTVLMTVYNGMPYLPEAIESVLNQTYADFKLLVVDDCSIDESRQVIRGYSDPRIRLLENEENLGQTRSLNRGLGMVDTELVARMDHDDISHPERLRKQVEFLVEHADIAVLGTCIRWIDAEGTVTGKKKLPEEDLVLRFSQLFRCPVVHGTVVYRHSVIWDELGGYSQAVTYSQDQELDPRIVDPLY